MRLNRIVTVVLIGCAVAAGMCIIKYSAIMDEMFDDSRPLSQGIIMIDSESEVQGMRFEELDCNPGIYYDGFLLPYDKKQNRLYLPQNYTETEWYGSLSAVIDGVEYPVYMLKDAMWEHKNEAIRVNHDFVVFVETDKGYFRLLLNITGMPLISVKTEREEKAEEVEYEVDPDKKYYGSETRYYGDFFMMDSGAISGRYEIVEAGICYHYKGASTAGFEKKSYSFDLLDYRGEKADISLVGLRSGSKWKLNALNTDINRIREITASRIWESIDDTNPDLNESGPNMEYVELIVDDEYKGIYCLVEPIDEKKLKLDQNDVIYKVIDWGVPDDEAIRKSIDMGWRIMYPIRIRYPKEIENYQDVWYPIQNYLNLIYRSEKPWYEEATAHINLENFADMLIFIMTVNGSDNAYKNTYYVAESMVYHDYVMKQIPWDLDYTFGNVYSYGVLNSVEFDENFTKIYEEEALPFLYTEAPEEIGSIVIGRWKRYRESFLDTANIIGLMEKNREYLIETGAVLREMERWPQSGVDMDIDYLIDFQVKRMEWLDSYFETWATEER